MHALQSKLNTFQGLLPVDFLSRRDFIGIRINEDGSEITVVVATDVGKVAIFEGELAASAPVTEFLKREGISLHVAAEETPTPFTIAAGTPGFGQGLGGYGTLGWFIFLDNELVCLSNHHVFCANGDETPLGTMVYAGFPYANGTIPIGSLSAFDILGTQEKRLFDLALASISDRSLIDGSFAACNNGTKYRYPQRLGTDAELTSTATYYTVGAKDPICSEGKFRGITSSKVGLYPGNKEYYFVEQLLFDPISSPGDSGSIIVNKQTNHVLGLVFAGVPGVRTLANPLYRKGWTYSGTKVYDDVEIPSFLTTKLSSSISDALDTIPDLKETRLPPFFTAGNYFLKGSCMTFQDFLIQNPYNCQVVQPFGNWVEIRTNNDAHGWLHAPTGIVYPF